MALDSKTGFASVLGYRLFYKSFPPNGMNRGTVLSLHGGPGMTHDYVLALADLSESGFQVYFYDQLGCGKSERPRNIALFTVERAVEEVEEFRKKMKLGRIHLIGSSYGGLLSLAYAIKYQKNLKSLTTIGGYANVPLAISEMAKLKSRLPKKVRATMKKYEDLGEYAHPKYLEAVNVFYRRHLCRMSMWPEELNSSLRRISKPVYYTMNGPNEFTIIGNTRYWNVTNQLKKIHVPTLVTGGKYDEISPAVGRSIHYAIKGSRQVIFQRSSHLPMWEERAYYMRVVSSFLKSVK